MTMAEVKELIDERKAKGKELFRETGGNIKGTSTNVYIKVFCLSDGVNSKSLRIFVDVCV